jgi:H+-transporting ATPase
MRNITGAAIVLGVCKLAFSPTILAIGKFKLGFGLAELQALAFATLVFGNQALLYVLRERRRLWHSRPSAWVLASSAVDVGIVATLASLGILAGALPWRIIALLFVAAIGFALVLDQIKLPVRAAFKIE